MLYSTFKNSDLKWSDVNIGIKSDNWMLGYLAYLHFGYKGVLYVQVNIVCTTRDHGCPSHLRERLVHNTFSTACGFSVRVRLFTYLPLRHLVKCNSCHSIFQKGPDGEILFSPPLMKNYLFSVLFQKWYPSIFMNQRIFIIAVIHNWTISSTFYTPIVFTNKFWSWNSFSNSSHYQAICEPCL